MKSTLTLLLAALVVAPLGLAATSCGEPPAGDAETPESRLDARGSEGFDSAAFDSLPWAPGILDRETGTYRLSVPRQDLVVTIDGIRLASRTALEGWAAFKPVSGGAVLTVELPLLVDEVNPVISAALLHDLRVTSLHSHFSREEPRLWYLHLAGIDETDSLAAALGAVLQTLEDVKGQPREPPPQVDPTAMTFDPAPVDSVLGIRGRMRQGAYELTLPRSTRLEGFDLDGSSGIATRVTFAGGPARAVVSGSFALLEGELQPVLKALRAGGIEIASIDDALVGEVPRLVFVHFWGRGRATELARVIRDALDATARAED
ncbi:MAG TPA: DUF1259 domain-containing protein [Gemmatimonadota bacterium]|nr:DUF1259 domain-containing protein [Gemmatimonadota bacterium]